MILNGWPDRRIFQFRRTSAPRLTLVDELKGQLAIERTAMAELKRQNDWLLKEVVELRAEFDRRNLADAVAAAPSPSAMAH